jgi:hypothetical protein
MHRAGLPENTVTVEETIYPNVFSADPKVGDSPAYVRWRISVVVIPIQYKITAAVFDAHVPTFSKSLRPGEVVDAYDIGVITFEELVTTGVKDHQLLLALVVLKLKIPYCFSNRIQPVKRDARCADFTQRWLH